MEATFQNYSTYHKTLKSLKSLFYVEPKIIPVANILRSKTKARKKKIFHSQSLHYQYTYKKSIEKFFGTPS